MNSKSDPIMRAGFTPACDIVIRELGPIAALVYGQVLRRVKMSKRSCFASIATMAKQLRLSRRTIERYLAMLEKEGYIKDITPDLLGYPHTYVLTDKVEELINEKSLPEKNLPENERVYQEVASMRQVDDGLRHYDLGTCDNKSQALRQSVAQRDNVVEVLIEDGDKEEREFTHSDTPSGSGEIDIRLNKSIEETYTREDSPYSGSTPVKHGNQEERKRNSTLSSHVSKKRYKQNNLTDKQRVALDALGKAMSINLTSHVNAPEIADFLIGAYAKGQGPNQYARWAYSSGMHKNDVSKYAAFPLDIIAEYPQAFRLEIRHGSADESLFNNELKDFFSGPLVQPVLSKYGRREED